MGHASSTDSLPLGVLSRDAGDTHPHRARLSLGRVDVESPTLLSTAFSESMTTSLDKCHRHSRQHSNKTAPPNLNRLTT